MKAPMVMLSVASLVLSSGCAQHTWESIQSSGHVIRNSYMAEAPVPAEEIAAVLKAPGLGGSSLRLHDFEVYIWRLDDHRLIVIGPDAEDVQAVIRMEPCADGRMRIRTFAASEWMEHRIVQKTVKQFTQIEGPTLYEDVGQGDQPE